MNHFFRFSYVSLLSIFLLTTGCVSTIPKANNDIPPGKISMESLFKGYTDTVITRDYQYDFLAEESLYELVKQWKINLKINRIVYKKEIFDCDDFSTMFQSYVNVLNLRVGVNVGVCRVLVNEYDNNESLHMLNGLLVKDDVIIIEPQNGEWMSID